MEGDRRALLISTVTYQDPTFRQLRSPLADIDALGGVLSDPEIGKYKVEHLNDAESHKVNQAIEKFFAIASLDDLIILYFSGHGFKDDNGRLYLVTTDSQVGLLASTAISAQFIKEQLDRCRSRRKVVILDCCYAGAFPDGATRSDDTVDLLPRLSGRGSAVMTATSAIGYALEGGTSPLVTEVNGVVPSIFTGALIDGLATGDADQDGDGLIGIDELYEYVYRKVKDSVPQQAPGWRGNIEGSLHVATNPRGPRPSQLPDALDDAVQHIWPSVRLAAVDELVTLCSRARPGIVMAVHSALVKLADDDSRKVMSAARKALEEIDERVQSLGLPVKANPRFPGSPEEMDIAQQIADQAIDETQREADAALVKARRQAEQITGDARVRAESLDRDAQERHRQAMGSLVTQRQELERLVDDLRALEREYRSRLKAYLKGQLRDLEAGSIQAEASTTARVDNLVDFEREYRSRLKAYLEGQLRDLEAGY